MSRVGMCEPGQLTMFFKTNRNWELLSPSAGKLFYSECIVSYGYNVTGNGKRERTPKGCQQWQENMRQAISGNAKWHVLLLRRNHQSATETLSLERLYLQIWKCSQSINGSESAMACKRCSKPGRKTRP